MKKKNEKHLYDVKLACEFNGVEESKDFVCFQTKESFLDYIRYGIIGHFLELIEMKEYKSMREELENIKKSEIPIETSDEIKKLSDEEILTLFKTNIVGVNDMEYEKLKRIVNKSRQVDLDLIYSTSNYNINKKLFLGMTVKLFKNYKLYKSITDEFNTKPLKFGFSNFEVEVTQLG